MSGGFATVYRATSLHSETRGQQVAIKIAIQAANLIRRVSNEVTIHFSLSHHSILGLYTYFEDATHVYLVTELCINGELFQYLSKRGRLTEPEARSIMFQVVKGVEYLHGFGIIHRDLKLNNLLLTDLFDVKIADFGLADGREGSKRPCGEIVTRKPYGLASDLWSLVKRTLDKVSQFDFELPDYISPEARDLVRPAVDELPKLY
ncbi:kinase-like domain-containing protein [Cladochytrium replicatum]|nr:kinase-like domain-containing protein [Cladochytrium replicatum]